MNKFLALTFCAALPMLITGQNILPRVNHTLAEVRITENRIDIRYDVLDTDNEDLRIECKIYDATNEKKYLEIIPERIQGDIGFPVKQGTDKQISIYLNPGTLSNSMLVTLSAFDNEPILIEDILSQVNPDSLKKYLLTLQGIRHTSNPVHYNASRQFISSQSSTFLNSKSIVFTNAQYHCINFESTKHGHSHPAQMVVLDAHYDSAPNSPGADDNASGVAGVIEAMRILSNYSFKKSLRFLFFDLEEAGLVGSNVYASLQVHKRDSIKGVINFEMIGYHSDLPNTQDFPTGFNVLFPEAYNEVLANQRRGDFIINVGNTNSKELKNAFHNNTKSHVPELKIISLEVPGTGTIAPDLRRSDHATFWDRNIPALMITDGANFRNKNYHTPRDSAHYLNFNFMADVVRAAMATMIELAEIEHGTTEDILIDLNTRVHPLNKNHFIAFYHNHLISIETNSKIQGARISILNPHGINLYSMNLEIEPKQVYKLKVPELSPGFYFIQIHSAKGIYTQKVFVDGR